jgi:hypothetical protein
MGVSVVVSGNFSKRLFNLKQGMEKIAPGMANKVGVILDTAVKDQIHAANAIASTDFIKSVSSQVLFSTTEYFVEIGSDNIAAPFIEKGRRAGGFPPVDRIYKWMVDKGLNATRSGAFLIARKIAERGYEPRHVFELGLKEATSKINRSIGKILESELSSNI